MAMSKARKNFQIVLLVALIAAAINFYLNMRDRRIDLVAPKQAVAKLDPDYYVTPKKLHPQDLKDAKELTQQPAWIREGYRFTYYPYNGHADLHHAAGTLGPIEKLAIKDVVLDPQKEAGERQVLAVFDKEGKHYAFPIGSEDNGSYRIYSDDILFIQDPRDLYKHWPADVWQAIDSHQVKSGMNELQASFAIGMGTPEGSGTSNPRVVDYPNNGHSVQVTYENGKATEIRTRS
jgi:hypothetical protein